MSQTTLTPIGELTALPSKRETQILKLIAFEFTSREIADQLHISTETVQSHRKNLMKKCKVKNVAGLIRKAFEMQILNVNNLQFYP